VLIDAHAHLDKYEDALESVLEEITQHRIFTVSTSMDLPSYRRNLEIGARCAHVLPTFGVHPWRAPDYVDRLADLSSVIEQSPMLGEIGLDYHWVEDASQYPAQQRVFEFFLAAAREQNKLINLHTKGAEKEVLRLLDHYKIRRTIVHWYSGPLDIFHELVAIGAYFTIGVEVLYSTHIQTIAREVPPERLLTETDNPGGWQWLTGALGMPLLVRDVVHALAGLRKTTMNNISRTVQDNFARLIQADPWLSETYTRLFIADCS
jgi:TatD DNase family protein